MGRLWYTPNSRPDGNAPGEIFEIGSELGLNQQVEALGREGRRELRQALQRAMSVINNIDGFEGEESAPASQQATLARGLHYVVHENSAVFIGVGKVDNIAHLSPLARAVMRCHLRAAERLLDQIHARTPE